MSTSAVLPPALSVGARAHFEHVIDAGVVDAFARLSGDHNPLHTDREYAARTAFGDRIAHGMICGALFSQLVGEHLPGERALYRSQSLRFVRPIPLGTRVRVSGEVVGRDEELALLRIRTCVHRSGTDELLADGEAEVVLRPPVVEVETDDAASPDRSPAGLLAGRRVLVVGGSRGIGAAIAAELVAEGAHLAVTYRNDRDAAETLCRAAERAGRKAVATAVDLAHPERVAEAVAGSRTALGGLDGLVLCGHGEIVERGVERGEYGQLVDAFHRSVGALYHATRSALPALRESRASAVVAVSSTVTWEPPPPCWTAYTVAKSALVGLARSLAVELGPDGVRVNLVSPALTETERNAGLPPRILDEFRGRTPLGRLPAPADVARAVVFLLSDRARFLTGVDLPIAGGMVLS